jgi:serine/threonine protein kinase
MFSSKTSTSTKADPPQKLVVKNLETGEQMRLDSFDGHFDYTTFDEGADSGSPPPPPPPAHSPPPLLAAEAEERRKQALSSGSDVAEGLSSLKLNGKDDDNCMSRSNNAQQKGGVASENASADNESGKRVGGKPCLDDYNLIRVLGKGSFGKVVLVRKKTNDTLYAMKVLSKPNVVLRKQVAHTQTERRVLGRATCPFIVALHAAFQNDKKLYLVLDYCPGGELFFHLSRAGRFPENVARFYTAEIVLALEHLHKEGIVYRDMKPENVLLCDRGHVKLADFGLAKEDVEESTTGCSSLCGTPEYLAPEVLGRLGHGQSVDWWGLGMLVYEMLTGLPPWYTHNKKQLLLNLRTAPITFPEYISDGARQYVSALLNRNPSERLGGAGDSGEVKAHPFFANIDWLELAERKVPVPIKPCKHHEEDTNTSNFSSQFTRLPLMSDDVDSEARTESLSPEMEEKIDAASGMFNGFTYDDQDSALDQATNAAAQKNEASRQQFATA